MRLIQFILNGKRQFGCELAKKGLIYNLSHISNNCIEFLNLVNENKSILAQVKKTIAEIENTDKNEKNYLIEKKSIERFLSPITTPDKLICVGMNYSDHCQEINAPLPAEPVLFNKFPSCIVGPYDDILYPNDINITNEIDWEVELAFVIGKKGKYIKKSNAFEYIAGYCVAMDVSARDLQLKRNSGQWLLGKSLDTFCPLGPALVTCDEISNVHSLAIDLSINNVEKQKSNTSKIIHRIDSIVAYISSYFTLLPGDVILTGTPGGVGFTRKPPEFLKIGDIIQSRIESIGILKNKIIKEP